MKFKNRDEAGALISEKLIHYKGLDPLTLGIPRGGVIIAKKIQENIGGSLGILVTKKITYPGNPEYAIGAVAENGLVVMSDSGYNANHISKEYLDSEIEEKSTEIKRRLHEYQYTLPSDLRQKIIILADDGIATGMTALAAIQYLRSKEAKKIVFAVPVAPADTIKKIEKEVDEVICLIAPRLFYAVGQFYNDFSSVSDEEVLDALHGKG